VFQLWSNCLSFWQAVLEYTAFFESDTLNPVTVSKKAQVRALINQQATKVLLTAQTTQ
jgi:hypothetical protein